MLLVTGLMYILESRIVLLHSKNLSRELKIILMRLLDYRKKLLKRQKKHGFKLGVRFMNSSKNVLRRDINLMNNIEPILIICWY